MFRSASRLVSAATAGGRSLFSRAPRVMRFAAVAAGVAAGVSIARSEHTQPRVAFAAEANASGSNVESKTSAVAAAGWASKQEVLSRLEKLQTGLASTGAAGAVKQLVQEWTQSEFSPVEYKSKGSIGSYVDHTLLKPVASKADIEAVVKEAVVNDFAGICVNSCNTALAQAAIKKELAAAGKTKAPLLVVVAGFPLGAAAHSVKKDELKFAIQNGANEVDVVINVGRLKEGAYSEVFEELSDLAQQAKSMNGKLKVIFETSMLSREEIIDACLICQLAKVDFVKTSTGFGGGGATVELIQLMSSVVKPGGRDLGVQVKASGGVRTFPDAIAVVRAGADRIGTSNGVAIAQGEKSGDVTPAGKGGY